MRRESFEALWPLFSHATKPAKEMTESFSALVHLRPWMESQTACRVIHVGDGAHARTAALFALKSRSENISVDPLLNEKLVAAWQDTYKVRGLSFKRARIEDEVDRLNQLPEMPVAVTFVHAHVNVDRVLLALKWDVAFTLSCCVPGKQLTRAHVPTLEGDDWGVLSQHRHFQVLQRVPGSGLAPRWGCS